MASPLLQYLDKSHFNVSLSPEEFRRLTLWLDCNANELGAYTRVEEQRRGEVIWPEMDADPANPLGLQTAAPAKAAYAPPRGPATGETASQSRAGR